MPAISWQLTDRLVAGRPAEGRALDVNAALVRPDGRAAVDVLDDVGLIHKGVHAFKAHPALDDDHREQPWELLQRPAQRVQQRQRREGGAGGEGVAVDQRVDPQRRGDDDDRHGHGDGEVERAVDRGLAHLLQLLVADLRDLVGEGALPVHQLDDADAGHDLLRLLDAVVGVAHDGALEAAELADERARDG